MINLILHSRYGDEYEIVAGGGVPLSSCGCRYDADDFTYTRQFISHLLVTPEAWRNLLRRLGYSLPPNINHPAEIFDVVARFCLRGVLAFYKLPRIESLQALSSGEGWGVCLVKGPNPHCHSELEVFEVSTPEEAEALLDSVSATEQNLVRVMFVNNMTQWFSFDGDTRGKVIQMLAKRELLAYKVEVTENAPPPKAADYVAAAGPGYDKVSLGPEGNPSPVPVKAELVKTPPGSLNECVALLEVARTKLDSEEGYKPKYTDQQQLEKVKSGSVSQERFLVSFQEKNTRPDAKLAFQRDSGLVPLWATSFDQLENADTDPKLIADILGTPYYPEKDYVMHIVDRGEDLSGFGQNTIVPTWDNMQSVAHKYLDGKHDPNVLDKVVTPEYQKQYAEDMKQFHAKKRNEFAVKDQEDYVKTLRPEDKEKFIARHNLRTEIGANNEFTGNGLTQSREKHSTYGVVETLTLANNPPLVTEMKNVITIDLKPRIKL